MRLQPSVSRSVGPGGPASAKKDYRVVALRKNISVARGDNVLFDEYRYFFYITADEVVAEARQRCNQENLIAQLKGGVRALHAPVNTLNANWAYMTMASLAWSIKAWCALLLPVSPRWADKHEHQRRRLLTMEFRSFRQAFIDIPCQIVTTARTVRWRVQAWTPGSACSSAFSTPSDQKCPVLIGRVGATGCGAEPHSGR